MKKKIIIIFAVLSSGSVFARVERLPKFSCQINRSVSLIITVEKRENFRDSIILQTQYFQEKSPKDVVLLPSPQIIDYGHTFIVVSDQGKGGYALIRIQESVRNLEDPKNVNYEAILDINLYEYNDHVNAISTNGQLKRTFCSRIEY